MDRSGFIAVYAAVLKPGSPFYLAAISYPYILYVTGISYGNSGTDDPGARRYGPDISAYNLL